MTKKFKYQNEYENSPHCFWELNPSKYVRILSDHLDDNLSGKKILDLGAGEGKNSVYLANLGGIVLAIDVSELALSRFSLQPNYINSRKNIITRAEDILKINFNDSSFDIVITYGVLHCLDKKDEIYEMVTRSKQWTKKNGFFVGCVFTNELPVPEFQVYLDENVFLDRGELKTLFKDWTILKYEDDIITETHPTSQIEHKHSLSRIIARKP